jgi:WD40 repeat protein
MFFVLENVDNSTLYGVTGMVFDMCTLDNDLLAVTDEKVLNIWNVRSRTLEAQFNTTYQTRLAKLENNLLASTGESYNIIIWNMSSFTIKYRLVGHLGVPGPLLKLDNNLLASGGDDNKVIIWNVTSGTMVKILKGHTIYISSLCYLDNGLLASGDGLGSIIVWDLQTGARKFSLRSIIYGYWWNAILSMIKLDRNLIANTNYLSVYIWNITSGKLISNLTGHSNIVIQLAFLDNNLLASGGMDNRVNIWNVITGELRRTLTNSSLDYKISSLIRLDNDLLAVSSTDGTIKIWDVVSGELKLDLNGWSSAWKAVRLAGNSLASAHTGYVKIWDSKTCK